ncbi:MAG: PAS domain S-box protein [Candidatus Sumerlaeota bacterium]|nr:PAS domain S-box protein [Candidatus Sumerlaeota bacterium]
MSVIPSSVLLIDRGLRILSANRNFLEKAQRLESATVGRRLDEVFPPGIVEKMNLERRIRDVFLTSKPIEAERMTYRAPGVPLRIYYYSIVPGEWDKRIECVVFLMEDVTEQIRLSEEVRQVERHLASVIESASDVIISADPWGRIISANPAGARVTGYKLEEINQHFFHELFAPEHEIAVKEMFEDSATLEQMKQTEWNLVTQDGRRIPVSWICSKMKNESEKVEGIVAVGRDLTEQRKMEAQILQSQKMAALGVMAGGIAHEIRNPLAVSSSAAQFLMEPNITPEFVKECADRIHTGIRRASSIIENLLRFARPAEPKDIEPVDLIAVIKDALMLVEDEARFQQVNVVLSMPETPVMVLGNVCLLQQMAMNLILNSCKAMPKGGVLEILLERNGDEVLLRIRDTGCGIPEKQLDKIFDPFFTTNPVGEGTGLGLCLCYSIVKQHFGAIEVQSAEGEGTTFAVRLPVLGIE